MALDFGKKTKGNDPVSKINADIAAVTAASDAAYGALGRAYFAAHENDAEEAFRPHIEAIAASKRKIDVLNELIVRMRGIKVCPNCKAEISSDSAFCNLCGTRIPEPEPLCDGENIYCNNCASPMPIGQKFCSFCGAKLPEIGAVKEEAAPAEPILVADVPAPDTPAEPVPAENPEVDVPAEAEEAVTEAVETAEEVKEAAAAEAIEAVETVEEAVAVEAADAAVVVEEAAIEVPEAPEEVEAPAASIIEEPAPEAPATQVCPACGKVLSAQMKFCTGCGRDLSAPVQNVCPNCGKTLSPEAVFCTGCGIRVK
jgi:RNA polymerase subunit RPABC4/transcription elongation factor Spt4